MSVRVNPRKVAALDTFVTLLWDSGVALAKSWRHDALSLTGGTHLPRACRLASTL